MNTYRITFSGREIGAIGIMLIFRETVRAESEEAAILKLYDRFEHILVGKLEKLEASDV